MKQTISIGSIFEAYEDMKVNENLPLEVGDYVIAVRASHGWASVKPGMVGQVTEEGIYNYVVNFGRYHSEWTGERYCFVKLGKELTGDLLKQVEKNENEEFLQKLGQLKKSGRENFESDITLKIQSLQYSDIDRVRATVPIREISHLRTFKGFRNEILQILARNVSSEVHPTRIERVGRVNALGYAITDDSVGELVKKVEEVVYG